MEDSDESTEYGSTPTYQTFSFVFYSFTAYLIKRNI